MPPDTLLPPARPRQSRELTTVLLDTAGVTDRVALVGIRGYYRDTMGEPGRNDRGIYDDALCVVSPEVHATFNANVDPSRWGINPRLRRPYACLVPGVWRYRLGHHKRDAPTGHPALVQAAPVTVERRASRDGDATRETGWFGINIHRGAVASTSSEGCQTLPPGQWPAFYALVAAEMKRHQVTTIPYLLLFPHPDRP